MPLLCGALVTLGCGGAALSRRIMAGAGAGLSAALLATVASLALVRVNGSPDAGLLALGVWRVFIFTILSVVGTVLAELTLPEPRET